MVEQDIQFTDGEMREHCMNMFDMSSTWVEMLARHPQMTPEYVDLIFDPMSDNLVGDIAAFFECCSHIQLRHIEMGMAYLDKIDSRRTLSYDWLADSIFNHPLCNEAMKVKLLLKRGG